MGCFMFTVKGLETSPYSDLLDPWHWTEVADLFAKDACKLLGLSLESPLEVRCVFNFRQVIMRTCLVVWVT